MLTPQIAKQCPEVVPRSAAGAGGKEPVAPKKAWADSFHEMNLRSFNSLLRVPTFFSTHPVAL
jgi:hypothetical protein